MTTARSILPNKIIAAIMAMFILFASLPIHAETFPPDTNYEVCFTPGEDCTSLIVNEISKANHTVYLQAYSFTSKPIAMAVSTANKKGIHVIAILDKSQNKHNKYSSATYLINQHIPVWIDYQPAIAHNKVIIIDNNTVITGSFNFTKAAQRQNAENVLIIHDKQLAGLYLKNFQSRLAVSRQPV